MRHIIIDNEVVEKRWANACCFILGGKV